MAVIIGVSRLEHLCKFKFHGSDPEKNPCNNHSDGCELTKKMGGVRLCKNGAHCDICGFCAIHCIGHAGVRPTNIHDVVWSEGRA